MSDPSGYTPFNNGSNINYVSSESTTATATTTIGGSNSNSADVVSASAATIITGNADINTNTTTPTPTTPSTTTTTTKDIFTLPDGRIMDSKNTLQSFDEGGGVTVPVTGMARLPKTTTTPDGRIIGGKNTLQSFAAYPPLNDGDGTNHNMTSPAKPPTLTLPDGRIIDGKNTLQSFDGATPAEVADCGGDIRRNNNTAPIQPPAAAFTLPDGRIIDGKNTLQSFAATPLAVLQEDIKQQDRDATEFDGNETDHGIIELANRNSNNNLDVTNNREDVATIHVEATPVRSVVVDAEIAHSQGDSNHPKRSWSFWLVIFIAMVLVGVVVGVGVYCGTGNCGGDTSANSSPSTVLTVNGNEPVSPPMIITPLAPIPLPTNSPIQQLLPITRAPLSPMPTNGSPSGVPLSFDSIFKTSEIDPEFETLDALFERAGLNDLEGEFTLLGPNDDAWLALGVDNLERLGTQTDLLGSLLRNHLIVGIFRPSDLIDRDVLTTIGGLNVTVSVPATGFFIFNTAQSYDTYFAGNGILYKIDSVLIDPYIPATRPINEQLRVACTFLSMTNLTACQTITDFVVGEAENAIPTEIGLLTQITYLSLSGNQLNGTIPSTLGYLTQLTYLSLSGNQLNGTIPSTLGNLTQLTYLSLSGNQLTGTIPSTLGNLIQLNDLYLRYNQLTGTIPSTLGNLIQLEELNLFFNQMTGTIPSTLGNLMQLTYLGLYNNQLTGTIPSTLGNLVQLSDLYLENNQLNGTIPSTLGSLTQLNDLWLFNNTQLSGTIPSGLCSISNIRIHIDCANIACTCCFDSYFLAMINCPTR